jgi:hypothetical protein
MATVKQVPQILPSGQLARCLPAAREHLSQMNAPVAGAAADVGRGVMSAVIADHAGPFGPDGLVQIDDVGIRGDLADLGVCGRDGDQISGPQAKMSQSAAIIMSETRSGRWVTSR